MEAPVWELSRLILNQKAVVLTLRWVKLQRVEGRSDRWGSRHENQPLPEKPRADGTETQVSNKSYFTAELLMNGHSEHVLQSLLLNEWSDAEQLFYSTVP